MQELSEAYAGAVALVYLSLHEGFGLPVSLLRQILVVLGRVFGGTTACVLCTCVGNRAD